MNKTIESSENITTLKELVKGSAIKFNNKILYRSKENNISYKEFEERVNSLGTALINMGLKNKKIAIISENRYEWEVSFFSIVCGSGVVVPIDKGLTKVEIENIIKRARIEAIFCSKKYEKILQEIKKENSFLKYIISFDLENEVSKDTYSFKSLAEKGQELISEGSNCFLDKKINEENICLIAFTSGTTSSSKAVMLSHKNICSNMINSSKVFDLTEKDICLSILPLNHVLEGLFCMLQSIYEGLERVFCNEIDEIIDYIKNHQITFMCGVPAIYEYLYKRKDELIPEAHHINMFMSGGAKLNNELVEKYKELGINLVQGYGITECGPVVSLENKDNKRPHSARKNYSKCRS